MELKHGNNCITFFDHATLLIVPYGIETWNDRSTLQMAGKLLIVPYGIETPY